MGPLTRRRNPFSRESNFVQSSKRSAAPGWQTGDGSRLNETVASLVRPWAERHEVLVRRTVAMSNSNCCMSRRRELALTRRSEHEL